MNELKVPETQGKRGRSSWSIVRQAQIIGTVFGALLTIAVYVFCTLHPPERAFDFSNGIFLITLLPMGLICKIFGISPDIFVDSHTSGPALLPGILVLVINSILCLVLGSLIGLLIKTVIFCKSNEKL